MHRATITLTATGTSQSVHVHGTNGLNVRDNVCHDIRGHAFFFEDGVERRNVLENNLALFIRHPSTGDVLLEHEGPTFQGGCRGQSLLTFVLDEDLRPPRQRSNEGGTRVFDELHFAMVRGGRYVLRFPDRGAPTRIEVVVENLTSTSDYAILALPFAGGTAPRVFSSTWPNLREVRAIPASDGALRARSSVHRGGFARRGGERRRHALLP